MKVLKLLKDAPYFKGLDDQALIALQEKGSLVEIKCGHPLLQQGDTSKDAYFLLDGRLRAILETEGEESTVLGEIGRGEVVGEMAAVFGSKRNATIIAVRNSLLLRLSSVDFVELLQSQKNSLLELSKTILKRSKRSFVPDSRISTVTLVPINANINLEDFSKQLAEAVSRFTSVRMLSSTIVKEQLSGVNLHEEEKSLEAFLTQQEDEYSMLIYQADPSWNKWTEACLARTDKILWIADATQSPEASRFERRIKQASLSLNHASHELVLLHPSRAQPPIGTRRWLENRDLSRHYHIASNYPGDIQRLARFLTGNAIGVALSGGGFRSSVQMGILHAMMEGGIPVDIIGGTSGGALIGGNFSQIISLDEFQPLSVEAYEQFKGTRKLTLPFISLYAGRKFTRAIKALSRGKYIEDLWIDFFCLSLSLVRGKLVMHTKGPMWEAIRASMAVNGILPPVMKDGDCLVDGGLVNSCPTDLLIQFGAGKSIAIVASSKSGIKIDTPFTPEVSGWNLLLKKLNPFYRKEIAPSIGSNILQSMYIASDHLHYRIFADSPVDLFIQPPIDEFPSMDVHSGIELYQFGYEYGLSHIEEWKAQLGINT